LLTVLCEITLFCHIFVSQQHHKALCFHTSDEMKPRCQAFTFPVTWQIY